MKCQLILLVAICLASVFSLPVPDEEVSTVQGAPVAEVKSDVAKKSEDKPVDAVASIVKSVESRAVEEKPAAVEATLPASAESPKPIEPKPETKKTEAKTDIKLDAPDSETAPAIPAEKKVQPINVEATLPAATADKSSDAAANAAEDKKPESKASGRAEEPIEVPKAVPLVEVPASNIEVQKQIVDEQKPAVHTAPIASGKSNELSKDTKAEADADNQETKAIKEEATQKLPVEEFKEPQTAERAIELKSDAKPAATDEAPIIPLEPVPDSSDIAPIALPSTEEKKLTEEKQPARQERIDEQKDASVEASAPANPANSEAKPAESNVQVLSATKNAAASEASAADPEAKPTAAASTAAELKSSPSEIKPSAGAAEVQPNAAKSTEQSAESATAAEPKKIDEPLTVAEFKAGGEPAKTDIVNEAEQQPLKKSEEQKPKTTSEEKKSDSENKSLEESKDSSESKESDESNDSKEDKSN